MDQDQILKKLLEGYDTKQLFLQTGNYSSERRKVHDQIFRELLNDLKPPGSQPAVIFLGGGVAAGKTSISKMLVESFKENKEDVLHIDADKIKTMLPEYKKLIQASPEDMAVKLHYESSDIATDLYGQALKQKLNVILDGTMKDLERYQGYIAQAQEQNYNISAIIVDVSIEEAMRRADIRYEIEKRRVPNEILRSSHQQVPLTFINIKDSLDSFYLYDTSNQHPQQFYVKYNGRVLVKNEERLAKFYEKSQLQIENMPSNQRKSPNVQYGKPLNLGLDRDFER